jgi:creatinine amidohydrolase
MLLENLAFNEVEAYLEQKDAVLIPIGSVEQHSPYGLIGTDFIVSEAVARKAAEALQVLVAATICYGASSHHMAFKGRIALSPQTLIALASDVVRSLVCHGFRRILFINGHGGNVAPLQTAFRQLKTESLPGYFDVLSWYGFAQVQKACKKAFDGQEGQHATPSEVSITRYLRPSEFSHKARDEQVVENPKYFWPLSAEEMRRVFPDGRMESAPWLATAEWGERLLNLAADAIVKKVEEIMQLKI